MKPVIEYPTFEQLDLRAGRVVSAQLPEWSRKLIEMQVDFGLELGTRTILSGIREWYQPSDLEQQTFLFVVNLAERKMGESVSQGMMLMADTATKPIVFPLPDQIEPGTLIR